VKLKSKVFSYIAVFFVPGAGKTVVRQIQIDKERPGNDQGGDSASESDSLYAFEIRYTLESELYII
jgi:hypothetical protein